MKTLIRGAIASIAAVSTLAWANPAFADTTSAMPVHVARLTTAAPADEYFGPLGLSVLGIRNSIAQTTLRLDSAGLDDADSMRSVGLVEASIKDWEAKYPADRWIPRMVLALHHAYRKIATEESLRRSVDVASWLISRYPKSDEAQTVRAELAQAISDAGTPSDASDEPPVSAPPPASSQ